jgi:sarcosine oxidase subunit beta
MRVGTESQDMSEPGNLPPASTKVVVVGGGIMGLFASLFLARAGSEVVLIEKATPMTEASGVNAGSLAVQNKLLPLIPYTLAAIELWRDMPRLIGADVGFRSAGGYRIATTDREKEALRRSSGQQQEYGVEARWIEGEELRHAAPWLSPEVRAATFSPQDSYANPLLLAPALARAAGQAGVTLCPATEVQGLAETPGLEIVTSRGTVRCEKLVIAAGAWSGQLCGLVGVHLPLSLDVNMVSVTEPAGPTIAHIVTHLRGILTLKQAVNGTCLIGGGWQGLGDLQSGRKEMEYESLLHNFRLAVSIVPGLKRLNLVRQWAGFEGVTPDSLPYLGALPGHPGILIVACARGGWTLGPVLGRLVAELVLTGTPSLPIDAFAPGRFENA